VTTPTPEPCFVCGGSRYDAFPDNPRVITTCSECDGTGIAADPQRTGTPPQPVQEPRTPAPGSPDTPETLSGPLSAPDKGTA
jgi:hypothetical protein